MGVARNQFAKGKAGSSKNSIGKITKKNSYTRNKAKLATTGKKPQKQNGRKTFKRYQESMEVVGNDQTISKPFDFKKRFDSQKKRFNGNDGGNDGRYQRKRSFNNGPGLPHQNGVRKFSKNTHNPKSGFSIKMNGKNEPTSASRKRVSFSNNLEHSRTIDEINEKKPSMNVLGASPGRGILRMRDKEFAVESTADEVTELPELNLPDKNPANAPLKISRAANERLANMDKKARREYIQGLRAKKHANHAVGQEAKMLWEKIRSSKCKKEERDKCIKQLVDLVRGKLKSLIYAHDTCRVIECLMALNNAEIRNLLFDELLPEIVRMSKSLYARFFVIKMLKYGTKYQKDVVIDAFKGHCVSMLKVINSAKVLELAYNDYANAVQRFNIVSEFYGPEYVIFRDELADLKTLEGIIKKYPTKKDMIVKNLESALEKVVTKETLKHSLTHKLLHDYLRHCSSEQRDNLIESLKTNLPEITHTMDGSKVAMLCIWNSPAKDRKIIVKSFKSLVLNACKDRFARRVLFAIFDSVDDTELVNKYITSDIANNIAELAYNKNGASVLHYLIYPRDVRHFTNWIVPTMSEGDTNIHSKKDKEVRYSELFDCIKSNLYAFLVANMETVIKNKEAATIALNALEPPSRDQPFKKIVDESDKIACFKAIAEILGGEIYPYDMKDEPHILRFGPPRFVFRKLMKWEPQQTGAKLSNYIAELPREHLASFTTLDSGCFTLLEVIQSGSTKGKRAVLEAVNLAALRESKLTGARVLLDEVMKCLAEGKGSRTIPDKKSALS